MARCQQVLQWYAMISMQMAVFFAKPRNTNWIFPFRWMNLTQLHNMKKRYWSEDPERRIAHGGVRSMFLFCRKSPPTIFSILHMHVTMFLFGWYFILLQRKDYLLETSPSSSNHFGWFWLVTRPGKHTKNHGKSPCFMGTFTISMAISIANCLFTWGYQTDWPQEQISTVPAAPQKTRRVSPFPSQFAGAEKPLMILWPDDGWINHDQPPISSLPQSDIATSPNQMEVFKGNIIFITVNVSFFGHNNPESALLRTTWSLNLQTQIRVVLDMLCLPAPLLNGRMIPSHRLSSC